MSFKWVFPALLLTLSTQIARADTYTVGVVPQFDIKTLHEIWSPILKEVGEQTGHEFVLKGAPDIPGFERAFADGVYDFAYMNPYHYTIAAHYQPLVKDHGRKLFGVLTVKADGGIESVNQLQGATIAFPAPNALGASLMIRSELENKYGISFFPRYVNTHSSVYLNVALGMAAAGGGVQKTFTREKDSVKEQLKILLKTGSVEPHPFTAKKDLPPELVAKVKDTLIAMAADPEKQKLLARVPFKKMGPAQDSDYDEVRALNLKRYYVNPK